jgi:aquaporin Z
MKPNVFLAELVGTFALVFIGAGVAAQNAAGLLGVALAFGLTLAVFVYLFGEISGTHINPAITLALALNGNLDWADAVFYWIAQFLGAIIAAAALLFVFGSAQNGLGQTVLADGVNWWQGLFIETILTFFLVNSVFFAAVRGFAGKRAGIVIGLTLAFAILFGGPLTGAALNPARALGPAIFAGGNALGEYWIFLVGPLLGACLATGFYRIMSMPRKK